MSPGPSIRRNKKPSRPRPPMLRASDEIRRISAVLGVELESFPGVTTRPMFGLLGYYRRGVIFAALPRTRALGSANSIIFKLNAAPQRLFDRARKDPAISVSEKGMAGWQTLEILSDAGIAAAQRWLLDSWRYALKSGKSK